jgi:hypothetical protein
MATEGRKGIGSHKHATSGHAPKSPRFKFMRQLEANKEENTKIKTSLSFRSVQEALGKRKK